MKLNILRCHGSGNIFLLADEYNGQNPPVTEQQRAAISRTLCDHESGPGADGMLFCQHSQVADCAMRMFNPDGSEAEMCGNGLRCAGRYAAEHLHKTTVSVETPQAVLSVRQAEPLMSGIATYAADIGPVSSETASLPMQTTHKTFSNQLIPELSDQLRFTALSIPNPHLIAFVTQPDTAQLQLIGEQANTLPLFPNGVNVSFVSLLRENTLFVITYERGAGMTDACGTAMSAASACSVQQQHCQREHPIVVHHPGGMVHCTVLQHKVILKGSVTFISDHQVRLDDTGHNMISNTIDHVYTTEIQSYTRFKESAINARFNRIVDPLN